MKLMDGKIYCKYLSQYRDWDSLGSYCIQVNHFGIMTMLPCHVTLNSNTAHKKWHSALIKLGFNCSFGTSKTFSSLFFKSFHALHNKKTIPKNSAAKILSRSHREQDKISLVPQPFFSLDRAEPERQQDTGKAILCHMTTILVLSAPIISMFGPISYSFAPFSIHNCEVASQLSLSTFKCSI